MFTKKLSLNNIDTKEWFSYFRKYRVKAGILLSLGCFYFAEPVFYSFLAGIPLLIIGEIIRIWASGHIVKSSSLTVSGPYSFARHPLYIGSLLIGIGFVLICRSIIVIIIFLTYFILFYPATIISEESLLGEKFKDSFKIYRQAVSAFFRKKESWYLPGRYAPFKFTRFIHNKEYKLVILLIIVLALLYIKMKLPAA
ncbi:MAG: hypothetical protein A2Y62_17035 [Candidatus Fischerbacteria bacterium RBG_13_37_8]|uniref:Protein-S-isoprenylcysteine methyltransferase n=1 Tax=Candidatus Fischerbacteria bacterium RBG_13_37_8 TaxID=1817863 RepID=A0A1F5VG08_9BACT|nr:MAG: hypothetical protein A2Y62_17035 [Candidatus Fischerbacteria bacterium RBG_13_37_8]